MAKKTKEVEVIDMHGAKTVAKKTSVVTHAKRIFLIVTVIWLAFVVWFPLHVKARYSGPIKKSIVVSMFFDLQRNIVEQYEKLLAGIKNSIDLEKPIGIAIEKVKIVEAQVDKVTDATAKAKDTTARAKTTTSNVKALTGLANKFGVKTNERSARCPCLTEALSSRVVRRRASPPVPSARSSTKSSSTMFSTAAT